MDDNYNFGIDIKELNKTIDSEKVLVGYKFIYNNKKYRSIVGKKKTIGDCLIEINNIHKQIINDNFRI